MSTTSQAYNSTTCQALSENRTLSTLELPRTIDQVREELYCRYAEKSDRLSYASHSIILAGFGSSINVSKGALVVRKGVTHNAHNSEPVTLYAGTTTVKNIVVLTSTGNVTLDAIEWCYLHGITIMLLNLDGSLIQTLTPEHTSNAALRRKQYSAEPLPIANWLLRAKTEAQLRTLRSHPELDSSKVMNLQRAVQSTYQFEDLNRLMTEEGRRAADYFSAFTGYPLKWAKPALKRIPPHWLTIQDRTSLLAPNGNGRHATCPYHSVLNYALSLLEAQVRQELNVIGLDPACGFLHSDKSGRDSLVFDLMEPHRAQVDDLVLNFIQKTTLQYDGFVRMQNGCVRLMPEFARLVVASCRMAQGEISITVRRLLDLI